MDNDGASDDTVGSNELDLLVLHGTLGVALAVRLDVSKVTYVSGLIGRSTVSLAMGVEVRAGRGAAVGVVTKGVDVEATLSIGIVASDIPGDGGGRRLGPLLLEDDSAANLGVTSKNSNCEKKVVNISPELNRWQYAETWSARRVHQGTSDG